MFFGFEQFYDFFFNLMYTFFFFVQALCKDIQIMRYSKEFKIADIIAKKAVGDISDTEQAILDEWIAGSGVNRETYEKFLSGESVIRHNELFGDFDPGTIIKGVARKSKARARRRSIIRWSSAASVLLIAASVMYFSLRNGSGEERSKIFAERSPAVLILDDGTKIVLDGITGDKLAVNGDVEIVFDEDAPSYNVSESGELTGYNTIQVPAGGTYKVKLPDGSFVVINARSKLRFPVPFPKDMREVWLDGEAYFEVAHNAERPFVVNFNDNNLRVTGTRFNIEAYSEQSSTATLLDGAVCCYTLTDSCSLTPGYQAIMDQDADRITLAVADTRSVTAWIHNLFYYENERLGIIMQEIGEWYGVDITFDDPALKDGIYSIEINRYESIDGILDVLMETGRIRYEQDGGKIVIRNN